jgi:predicted NBD/HSP70 family sugar kinase
VLTRRGASPGAWLDEASAAATAWRGRFRRIAVAVPRTKAGEFMAAELGSRLGMSVTALPEAQAAAWAEHRFGAGAGGDLVFIAVGAGVAGAVVIGGKLLRGTHGVAGRLGDIALPGGGGTVEQAAGAPALLRRGATHGARNLEAILAGASAGASWASALLEDAATAVAGAVSAVQLVLDPPRIVVGGPIGTATGFIDRLSGRLADVTPRPNLVRAALGPEAAQFGVADHDTIEAGIARLPAPTATP